MDIMPNEGAIASGPDKSYKLKRPIELDSEIDSEEPEDTNDDESL
tara:strand:+ start:2889 stop:3023 length:135 start_codon:yes stop_codon:yes gene_type:complete